MTETLYLLLRTFLDILALRKGPEHIPRSWLLLALAAVSMLFAGSCAMLLIEDPEHRNYGWSLVVTAAGVSFYLLVLLVTGHSRRMLQTMTAILGCGAILTLLVFLETILLQPLLGTTVAGLIALLIIFWSVPVEGHIIARAIDRHWYIGIALAVVAFALQYSLQVHGTQT